MISILSPTARRIFSNGSSAAFNSAGLMYRPSLAMAAGSNGQIFIAVMPASSRLSATASARVMKPFRSSYGPALSSKFQVETGLMLCERT